jgi:ubiquitin thioesterase protein OTUB1
MSEALAFGYFEALLHAGHRSIIDDERARLESLNRMLDDAGHPKDLYEDFTQKTFDLLEAIAERLPCRDDGKDLLERFNEDGVSSAIITHFRVSWIGNGELHGIR